MNLSRRMLLFTALFGVLLLAALLLPTPNAKILLGSLGAVGLALGLWFLYRPLRETEAALKQRDSVPLSPKPGNPLLSEFATGYVELEEGINKAYSATVLDKQAQIGVLQNQINPHFLYNTLESIRGEALDNGCTGIAKMARALAAFFRYSINLKEDVVTLADEIANIRNYFTIQEYRFDNKFSLRFELEDEDTVLSYYLPKLTIQPIVENAIFHGLETQSKDGCVLIRAFNSNERFGIVISDNGVGMDGETLTALQDKLNSHGLAKTVKSVSGNGVALQNVNQRIKLLFGQSYGMQVYSTPGVGTDVELTLPIVRDSSAITKAKKL